MRKLYFSPQKKKTKTVGYFPWHGMSFTGKYGVFWDKKLMEIWCLPVTENFLFWTFREWEIWSFFETENWYKDNIYLVFLSFLRYSRTRETHFFVLCCYSFGVWHLFLIFEKYIFFILKSITQDFVTPGWSNFHYLQIW